MGKGDKEGGEKPHFFSKHLFPDKISGQDDKDSENGCWEPRKKLEFPQRHQKMNQYLIDDAAIVMGKQEGQRFCRDLDCVIGLIKLEYELSQLEKTKNRSEDGDRDQGKIFLYLDSQFILPIA